MSYALPWNNLGVYSYGGLGRLGAVSVAAWKAGTQVHYHNDSMVHNSFSGYSDSNVRQAFANSGLFVPTTVQFTSSPNFLGLTSTVDLVGVLPVDVNQADVAAVIEGLIKNFFVSSPSTATYSPEPNATQSVDDKGKVVVPVVPTAVQEDDSRGIAYLLGDPNTGDYDVVFNDGTSGIFDENGNYYLGSQGGIKNIAISTDDAGQDDGFQVTMSDGVEVYFDLTGAFLYSFDPSGQVTPTNTGTQIVKTIKASDAAKGNWNAQKVVDDLGLTGLVAGLGIGAGAALIVGGAILYVVLTKK